MQITKENYELYAIDYLEGGLTGEELRCMETFLEEHPEIKSELLGLESISLIPEVKITFSNKDKLLKKEYGKAFPWLWSAVIVVFIALLIPFLISQNQTETKTVQSADKKSETVVQKEHNKQESLVEEKTASVINNTKTAAIVNSDNGTNVVKAVQTSKGEESKIVEPSKIESSEEIIRQLKRQAESDSLKKVLDSLQLQNGKPKLEFSAMPLASLELKPLDIIINEIILSPKMLLELTALQNNGKSIANAKKPKSFKTPFGTIRFNDIRDALLPESYIAAAK